jgi:hypothetical protein
VSQNSRLDLVLHRLEPGNSGDVAGAYARQYRGRVDPRASMSIKDTAPYFRATWLAPGEILLMTTDLCSRPVLYGRPPISEKNIS